MANKLRMDLELDSKGYQQGAEEAARSTKDLKQQTEDYLKDFGSLRKQMAASKKEVQNLAGAYASLSKTEKESELGKEMAAQLNIAIEKAAEFQDVMGDVQQAIKNASSDTQTWDALKEGMEIGKSATLAYAGAVAKLTGNEEDLTKLVKTLTIVENGFNATIQIGNALQKQSAVMTGIRKIQMLAAAKAEELQTAATVKGTIAQKAFNAVAKANPYILLATVAVTAATAIGGYMLATKKAGNEEKKLQEEINNSKEALNKYASSVGNAYGKLRSSYEELRTQWNKLSTLQERTKFLITYKKEINELTNSVKGVDSAENFFNGNTSKVIQSFEYRARAAAAATLAVEKFQEAMELAVKSNKAVSLNGAVITADVFKKLPQELKNFTKIVDWDNEGRAIAYTFQGLTSKQDDLVKSTGLVSKNLKEQAKTAEEEAKTFQNLGTQYRQEAEKLNPSGGSGDLTKDQQTRYDKLKKNVEDIRKQILNLDETKPNFDDLFDKLQEKLYKAQRILENFEIAHGIINISIELPKVDAQIDKWFKDFNKKIEAKNKELSAKQAKDTSIVKATLNSNMNIQQANNKIRQTEQVPVELDFEIPENMSDKISKQKNSLDALVDALVVAETEKIKFANAGDTAGVTAMTEQIERLSEAYDKNSKKLETNLEKAKRISEISKGFKQAGEAVGAFGDMFSALGDATDDAGLKVMGIIAQAIATITLSFAQALTSCKTWIDWLIFGVTGMTTMITMIAQIKQLTAGSYAQGGIIPGSSYHGDRLIASVNSGEMILNTQQQNRLLDMANGMITPMTSNDISLMSFRVRGRDLLLVMNNELKSNRKKPID